MTGNLQRLTQAGYAHVVPIIPPTARLSAASKIDPANLGKIPGRVKADGTWSGFSGPRDEQRLSRYDFEQCEAAGAGAGLLAFAYPAVDCDVKDPQLSAAIREALSPWLADAPERVGMPPKWLRWGRLKGEKFSKRSLSFEYKGERQLVEFLGAGCYYNVLATHPRTMQPYTVTGDMSADALPEIGVQDRDDMIAAVEQLLSARFLIEIGKLAKGNGASGEPGIAGAFDWSHVLVTQEHGGITVREALHLLQKMPVGASIRCQGWEPPGHNWRAFVKLDHVGRVFAHDSESRKTYRAPEPRQDAPATVSYDYGRSAEEGGKAERTDAREFVEGRLYPGAHACIGAPKSGKGYLLLDLLRALETGGTFAGGRAQRCDAVYIAAEDTLERLNRRQERTGRLMRTILLTRDDVIKAAKELSAEVDHVGFVRGLCRHYLPNGGVVIVDSAETFRAMWYGEKLDDEGKGRVTSRDYQSARVFDGLGLELGVCAILVNHTSKRSTHGGGADFHERTNMTNAYFAGLTGSIVLALPEDVSPMEPGPERVLAVRNREHDGGDLCLLLRFTPSSNLEYIGPYYETRMTKLAQAIGEIIVTGMKAGETRVLSADIGTELGISGSAVKNTITRMRKSGRDVLRVEGVYYKIMVVQGNKGGYSAVKLPSRRDLL